MKRMKYIFWRVKKLSRGRKIGIVIGVVLLIGLILIPFSFAELTPVKSVNIYSENTSYDDNNPGAWKIQKSGKWVSKGTAEVTFKIDTRSMIKSAKTDVILVLDTSGSMVTAENYDEGYKARIDILKENCIDFFNNVFTSGDNRVGLIRFSSNSEILANLTKDIGELTNQINRLSAYGETNYYDAFVNVANMLKDYHKEDDREAIVLFLTDGLPNINAPNEVAEYNFLKSEYPWLTVNIIQYEMGNSALEQIKKVSDNQFVIDSHSLNNALLEASVPKLTYEKFTITDYIDTRYFNVESTDDITINNGTVALDKENQKIIWNISNLRTGLILEKLEPEMTIKTKLKEDLLGKGGVYPTNSHEIINTKIENQEENVDSDLTPILADNYKVIYEANPPIGCSVSGTPEEKSYSVFDTVDISKEEPVCEGYKFKGWKIVNKNVVKLNSSRFVMPEENVQIKGTWSRLELKKAIEGKMYEIPTLYELMRDGSRGDDKNLDFSTSKNIASTYGIYQYYETRNDDYPVYYYRGEANNNIKYANMCWKIVRTTETGGTKLIYNGLPAEDGSCNNTGDNSTIGRSSFNGLTHSPTYVGYKYGKSYDYKEQPLLVWYEVLGKSKKSQDNMTSTYYYYGDGVTYQDGVGYTLNNATQYHWSDYYSNLGHYYTCLSDSDGVCEKVYFILSGDEFDGDSTYNPAAPKLSYVYYIEMENGETYESLYSEAQKAVWKFSNDVVYNAETDSYILSDPVEVGILAYNTEQDAKDKVNNAHYTCFTDSNECKNNVYFVYSYDDYRDEYSLLYVTLNGGVKIEDVIDDMTSKSTNEYDSDLLENIDKWYEKNIKDKEYEKNIEDTIWCSDRSIYSLGGWARNGNILNDLLFGSYGRNITSSGRPSLECVNEVDRFSTTNEKAKLKYPVGVLTADELTLAGNGYRSYGSSYLSTGDEYWILAPLKYSGTSPYNLYFYRNYLNFFVPVNTVRGIRPSIALKPGAMIEDGDGTADNPYVLFDEFKPLELYNIVVESSDVESSLTKAIKGSSVLLNSKIKGKEILSFKLNGKKIKGNSFIMPNKEAVITDVELGDIKAVVFESEHNPYANDLDNEYEKTFNGAVSLTVELEYETEDASYDYVYLYDSDNNRYGKYGGKTRKTDTITISGDYIKILFHTDSSINDYYGFKATVTPNFD